MGKARKASYENKLIERVKVKLLSEHNQDLSFNTIKDLCNAKWEFLHFVMRFGELENFRDKYLGIFGVRRAKGWSIMLTRYFTEEQREVYENLPTQKEKVEYGIKCFDEFRAKSPYIRKKDRPVVLLSKTGRVIKEFKTITEAAKAYNLLPISVYISCVKKVNLKYNRRFKFINIEHQKEETEGKTLDSSIL